MRTYMKLALTLIIVLTGFTATCQITRMQPLKAPRLFSSLNGFSDSASVPYQEIRNFIGMQLVVMDSAKNKYQVSSFQVMYRRLGVTENEKTNKITPSYTFSSERFSGNQLSPLWQRIIREESKPTESLRFFDIIVKGESGRLMFANDLLIKLR